MAKTYQLDIFLFLAVAAVAVANHKLANDDTPRKLEKKGNSKIDDKANSSTTNNSTTNNNNANSNTNSNTNKADKPPNANDNGHKIDDDDDKSVDSKDPCGLVALSASIKKKEEDAKRTGRFVDLTSAD